ncbi:SDR family NAD(P)-dependent oxidoreductase [uncultured Oscillibacter sp.]|uniref:SDR family NAD(P)-dependent oxidoreductase n=1 Tax=uncultured Oscillibacter sp. TaxID=876091 RepID=UPI0025CE8C69|nr:SDR family NAD(P)-dependent oxidoreductase [uncultured Oscillibacter sp.]
MTNLFDISGRKAIVTGGTRGLGYGMAEGLMEAGASVVIFGSTEKAESVAAEFRGRGFNCHGLKVDLANAEEREQGFHKAVELLGGLDILINAAGIQRRYPCEQFPKSDWDEVIEVNLTAPFVLSQMAAREFLKKTEPAGKIINIASMATFFGGFTVPAYAAAKGGVAQFSKDMCNELAGRNINVNCIAPGYMDTEMNTALTDPANPRYKEITDRIPAHRWGTGEDMKGAAIFLASRASDYLNGAVIPVDGGYLVK